MSRSRGATFVAGVIVAALAHIVTGCKPQYDHTDITNVVRSKLGGDMSIQHLGVPEGMILKAHIVVYNDHKDPMPLEIRSSNPDMVEVAMVVSDRDYAFIGKRAGHAEIQFIGDGQPVVTIEADVTPQPRP
jgi:hypothetical protein